MTLVGERAPEARSPAAIGYRPALDGVRALAIIGVIVAHAFRPAAEGGAIGVEVFFALSGFLITTLLLEEWERSGRIRLRAFWGRRIARLFPALGALMIATTAYALAGTDPGTARRTLDATGFVAFYGVNWYWAYGNHPGLYGHLWSLAVEEQFYLVWPPVLAALGRLRAGPARAIAVASAAGMGIVLARRMLSYPGYEHLTRIYGTDYVADQILAGCGVAAIVWMVRRGSLRWIPRAAACAFPWGVGILAVTVVVLRPSSGESAAVRWFSTWGLTAIAVASSVLIAHLVLNPHARAARALSHRTLVWLGERSYGLYLYHVVVYVVIRVNLGVPRPALPAVQIGASIALAALSFAFLERPARAMLRRRLAR